MTPARLRVSRLEDRLTPSTPDLTEGNAADWTTFTSDGATASVSNDTARVAEGAASLRFDTASGFDTGVRLTAAAPWDVSADKQLAFWTYALNPNPLGFQGPQPVVGLVTPTGIATYTPGAVALPLGQWKRHHVPLAGGFGWTRTDTNTPDLTRVTAVVIHQDTWDTGFTVWYDGVRFDPRPVTAQPDPGPAPPTGVVAGRVEPRVLLYAFDPVMENHGGQRLHQVYGWGDPVTLTQQSLADLTVASHGLYQPTVVETVVADEHPYFLDGFQHTDASFDVAWADRDFHSSSMFDYPRFIREHGLAARVDAGEFDEVWVYAPPIAGMYESVMAGRGAYWINGPTQPAGDRVFPVMGLNYERGVGEAIHSFGHRAENTVAHAYDGAAAGHAWTRFTRLDKDAPGQGGVGNVHFPVNGQSDYDYYNPRSVASTADDWLNYPNLTGATTPVSRTAWSPAGADPQREYLNWWYGHMPHVAGRGTEGRLNNWWRYLGDLDAFKGGGDLSGADGTGRAWVTGLAAGQSVSGVVAVGGDALLDGKAGRMDLYVDGVYRASDTLAPFTFRWDTAGLAPGEHTVEVRAYDVQVGTETRSPLVAVVAPGAAVSIGPGALPATEVGSGYSQQLTAFGTAGPFTFRVSAGLLPPGLTLTAAGLLSGVPRSPGQYVVTVTATAAGGSGSREYIVGVTLDASPVAPVLAPADPYGPRPNQTQNQAFVKGLYRTTLGRDADTGGVTSWVTAMANGATPLQVTRGFWNSPENRARQVDGYYLYFLGRGPDAQGRQDWMTALLSGAVDEIAVASLFLQSPEAIARGGTTGGYVDLVYQAVLNRPADAPSRADWVQRLDAGTVTRPQFVAAIVRSAESYDRILTSFYRAYLKRAPSAAELADWRRVLDGLRPPLGDVAVGFVGSAEFYANAAGAVG